MMRWGVFSNAVSSASVVALPRVMAISVSLMRLARLSWSIQSRSWSEGWMMVLSDASKSFLISVLSLPRMRMTSYPFSIAPMYLRISSKITRAHWLPQMMRRCFLSVFQEIKCLIFWYWDFLLENTLWSICPITSHFFALKYTFALSNPRNTVVAK